MTLSHRQLNLERLLSAQTGDGSWGYRTGDAANAEPTALSAMALRLHGADSDRTDAGLRWLAAHQTADGGVPIEPGCDGPYWPTGLAMLAWAFAGETRLPIYETPMEKASHWLTTHRGESVAAEASIFGHDEKQRGWSWVDGTHSWVEPTAYAVLGLRAAAKRDHPCLREGVRMLLDRTLPNGGWNYGNTRVFGNTLRPFPATTGIALAALAGEPSDTKIAASVNYLAAALTSVRAPMSLGWGLIGLAAWGVRPLEAPEWLERCGARAEQRPQNVLETALVLLATLEQSPFRSPAITTSHE